MNKEFQIAPFPLRIGAWFIDFLLIFLIWYLCTTADVQALDELMKTLDPDVPGALDIFAEEVIKLYLLFIVKLLFVQTVYYTIFPAIFGNGKTLGKLIFGISMVSRKDLSEISASRLMFREFVLRGLLETILIIPLLINIILVIFSKESKTIHDRLAKTIVIKDKSFIESYDYSADENPLEEDKITYEEKNNVENTSDPGEGISENN